MQHVPVTDRLGSCSLVNRRLHAAAVAATAALVLHRQRVAAGLRWLSHYGHHVTALTINGPTETLWQLPCPNLLELVLETSSVQLGPSDDGRQPGVLRDCTKLTSLKLFLVHLVDVPDGGVVDCLSRLVNLQSLDCWLAGRRACALSGATLPRLQHLTHLGVVGMSDENLLQLGGLTRLQELRLGGDREAAAGPHSVPGLALPASIAHLMLSLRAEVAFLSLVPAGLRRLDINRVVEGPVDGPGCLLSCIARLQRLTALSLDPSDGELPLPPPGPAFSALTASSGLVRLGLLQADMPAGVWPHVFPASRHLLQLTSLSFVDLWRFDDPDPPAALGAADLASLVSCCPELRSITTAFLQHGQHVSQLRALTALTCLGVRYGSGVEGAYAASLQGLGGVTQLRVLDLTMCREDPWLSPLLPLTSLTRLTYMQCSWRPDGQSHPVSVTLPTTVSPQ